MAFQPRSSEAVLPILRGLSAFTCGLLLGVQVSSAGVPGNLNLAIGLTPSSKVDTRYRDGNDGTSAIPLAWATIPTIAGVQGTPQTVNLRTLYLTEPGGSTISTVCSPAIGGGWSTTADGLSYTYSAVYNGSCTATATLGAASASKTFVLTSTATGADATAPATPLGAAATQITQGIHLTWGASSDPLVTGEPWSGLSGYRIYKDGNPVAFHTTAAAGPGQQVQLVGVELGGSTGGSTTQSANNYTIISNGDLGGTQETGQYAWMSVTGDFTFCAKMNGISGGTANAHSLLMARNSLTANDLMVSSRQNTTGIRPRQRTVGGAVTAAWGSEVTQAPPAFHCLKRTGTTWLAQESVLGNVFITTSTTNAVTLSTTLDLGLFVGTGSGSTTTADIQNVILTAHPPLAYDDLVTDGLSHIYQIKAQDVAGNLSVASLAVSATAPGIADVTAPTVPTAPATSTTSQSTITFTWTASTDASGIRGYVVSVATTSGGTYTDQPEQPGTSYVETGLAASTTRWFKVRAIDNAGNTSASTTQVSGTSQTAPAADVTAPTVPSGNAANGQNTTVIRITTAGSTDAGCGVADYRLYRSTASGGVYSLVATFTGLLFDYDSGGPASTTYFFRLSARDCASPQNESAQSAFFSGSTLASSGGTLLISESWPTLYDTSLQYPNNLPLGPNGNTPWKRSTDPGCTRSVDGNHTLDAPGAFHSHLVVQDWQAYHCMLIYTGTTGPGRIQNLEVGKEYWIGFGVYLQAPWLTNTGSGSFDIMFQMHGLNTPVGDPNAANNPMFNLKANGGVGQPWVVNIVGDSTQIKPYERNINYRTCGNISEGWTYWIVNLRFGGGTVTENGSGGTTAGQNHYVGNATPGFWKVWRDGSLCVDEAGLNYFVSNTLGPFFSLGDYHGQATNSPPIVPYDTYIDKFRMGRAVDGVGLADVNPQ